VLSGVTVILNVAVSGSVPITYQWDLRESICRDRPVPPRAGQRPDQSQRKLSRAVTNPIRTVTSAPAALTVLQRPVFIEQPSSTNVAGGTAFGYGHGGGNAAVALPMAFQPAHSADGSNQHHAASPTCRPPAPAPTRWSPPTSGVYQQRRGHSHRMKWISATPRKAPATR
jgi:hypothetical protein